MGSSGDSHSRAPGPALSCAPSPCIPRTSPKFAGCVEGLLGGEGREAPLLPSAIWVPPGGSCGHLFSGPDHWRQGSHAAPTMQVQRGAPRPGLSPGLVLPGSGPEGGQKGEKEAANVGSVQQSALILTQARWGNRGSGPVTYPKPVWGTLRSPIPDGKMGGPPRLAAQVAGEGGGCGFPHAWGQGISCRLGIKKQRELDREGGTLTHDRQRGSEGQRIGERTLDL